MSEDDNGIDSRLP